MGPGKKPLHGGKPVERRVIRRKPEHKIVLPGNLPEMLTDFAEGEKRAQLPFTSIEEETKFLLGTRIKRGEAYSKEKHGVGQLIILEQLVPVLRSYAQHLHKGATTAERKKNGAYMDSVLRTAEEKLKYYRQRAHHLGEISNKAIRDAKKRETVFVSVFYRAQQTLGNLPSGEKISLLKSLLTAAKAYDQSLEMNARFVPKENKKIIENISEMRRFVDRQRAKAAELLETEEKHAKRPKR